MLNLIIEDFDTVFEKSGTPFRERVVACLDAELKLLADVDHLEANVIGKPLYQWDYRAIDEGLLDLMKPFMVSASDIPVFFMHLLDDLGCDPGLYEKASILLEYTYYATGVIDLFNFHDVFTRKETDLLKYSELTQLRYAVQYLMQYPRYLIMNDEFNLDDRTNIALHRLYANVSVAMGTGRGVFLKWSNEYYSNLAEAHYFQNAVDNLNNYLVCPAVLAGCFANVSYEVLSRFKKGFAALTLFAKLRQEKNICKTKKIPVVDDPYTDTSILLTFPGMALLTEPLEIDQHQFSHLKFPFVPRMHQDLLEMMVDRSMDQTIERIENMERKYFKIFLDEIEQTGLLETTVGCLRQCYGM